MSKYTSISVRHHHLLSAQDVRDKVSELALLPVLSGLNVPCAVVYDALNNMIQQIWRKRVAKLRVSVHAGGSATCVIEHETHLVEAVGQRSKALHMS